VLAVDREMDTLKDEARELAAAVEAAKAAAAEAAAGAAAALAALEAARAEERTHQRQLDEYTARRDRTRRLIESGAAPDYAAADKQLTQLTAIVDDMETGALLRMDAREAAERAHAAAGLAVQRATHALDGARARQAARRPEIEARFTPLKPRRDALAARLPGDIRQTYDDLRQRRKPVVVTLQPDGQCPHCHLEAPPQLVNLVRRCEGLQVCRGCGCWFDTSPHNE
jgi:predicted  nucleic acid-binding Zn-ribbon protein